MSTEIKQVTMFQFASTVNGAVYNFQIPAETRSEACQKLGAALAVIVEELKNMPKVGPN